MSAGISTSNQHSASAAGAPAFSRTQQLILAGLALLLLVAVLWRGAPEQDLPYDPAAPTPEGTLALRLWLEEMGYSVTVQTSADTPHPDADLWIIFPGLGAHSAAEVTALAEWTGAGNTLVLIGLPMQEDALIRQFGVTLRPDVGVVRSVRQLEPILPERPAEWGALTQVRGLDLADAPHAQPVLAAVGADEQPRITAALQPWEQGRIWHLDPLHDLANGTLQNEANAAILTALLRHVPNGGQVVLGATHLAAPPPMAQVTTLRDWLWSTRPGIAVLLACGLTLLYLALQGVRLGPAVQPGDQTRRRAAAEYVAAMAGLYQRGNRRGAVAARLKQQLKRRLAQSAGVDASVDAGLNDAEFVAKLEGAPAELAELLRELDAPHDDTHLLRLARRCDELLRVADPRARD